MPCAIKNGLNVKTDIINPDVLNNPLGNELIRSFKSELELISDLDKNVVHEILGIRI